VSDVFHIAPTDVRYGVVLIPALIVVLVLSLVALPVSAAIRGARDSTFELSAAGLRLRGDFYGRFIPLAQLRPAEVSRVAITTGPLRPVMRIGGTALPGYRAGWFRLANGSKALLYVTDATHVVQVPTTAGYTVLLSVAETEQFIERMHTLAQPGAAR
jgi:hypothetical protein